MSLYITDSVLKADAAVSKGICCIDLLGDWCWSRLDKAGERKPLPGWSQIKRDARQVFVVFDSDFIADLDIYSKLLGLSDYLEGEGARVGFIYLPAGTDGKRMGIHDFLAAGHEPSELERLAGGLRPPIRCPYRMTPEGIVWDKPEGAGRLIPIPLTNFAVEIIGDVHVEDGLEVRREFELEAIMHGETMAFRIPAPEFKDLAWVLTELGPAATVYARKEHEVRTAIQLLSRRIVQRRIITHMGGVQNGDEWGYAHADGIIWDTPVSKWDGPAFNRPRPKLSNGSDLGRVGSVGPVPAIGIPRNHITVDLSRNPMALCRLPPPPNRKQGKEAFQAALRLLELGGNITIALIAAVFRAPLGYARFSLHLTGPSGTYKSEVMALCQQFWGPALNVENFIGNWSSTANQLEELLFHGKEMVIGIDEFVAHNTPGGDTELYKKGDRVFRAQGNCSSRGRLQQRGGVSPNKRPRGLLLSCGEMLPAGLSVLARIFVLQFAKGHIPADRLGECQTDAANGLYAQAMAYYVQILASHKSCG